MNNEEKILEMLSKLTADVSGLKDDVSGLKGDVSSLKAMQEKQGKLLEAVDQRSKRTAVLLETEYRDKLQLLFDGHSLIEEKLDGLAPKSRVENLEEEVAFLRSVVVSMNKRLDALEKAQ